METPTESNLGGLVVGVIREPIETLRYVTTAQPSGALRIAILAAVVPYLFFGLAFLVVAVNTADLVGPTGAGILAVPLVLGLIPIVIGALVGLVVTAGIYHIVALTLKGGAKGTYDGLLSGLGFSLVPQLLHAPVAFIGFGVGILYVSLDSSPPFFESFLEFANASGDEAFLRLMGGFWAFLLVQLSGFSILGAWTAVLGFIAFWQNYSFSIHRALVGFVGPGILGVALAAGGAVLTSLLAEPPPLVADASALTRLTHHPADDYHPVWSPDGTKIAFISERDEDSDIYVMGVDGENQVMVTNTPGVKVSNPSWSPDGEWIIHQRTPTGAKGDIWEVRADGTDSTQLTTNVEQDTHPALSPDGTRIAFISSRDGDSEIYVMTADGTDIVALTSNEMPYARPTWSPDGTLIAVTLSRESKVAVYVMNADGSGLTKFANGLYPTWSPDGVKIAYNADDSNLWGTTSSVFVRNADGSGRRHLTYDWRGWQSQPAWSPNDTRIAFVGRRYDDDVGTDNTDIYVVNIGSALGD